MRIASCNFTRTLARPISRLIIGVAIALVSSPAISAAAQPVDLDLTISGPSTLQFSPKEHLTYTVQAINTGTTDSQANFVMWVPTGMTFIPAESDSKCSIKQDANTLKGEVLLECTGSKLLAVGDNENFAVTFELWKNCYNGYYNYPHHNGYYNYPHQNPMGVVLEAYKPGQQPVYREIVIDCPATNLTISVDSKGDIAAGETKTFQVTLYNLGSIDERSADLWVDLGTSELSSRGWSSFVNEGIAFPCSVQPNEGEMVSDSWGKSAHTQMLHCSNIYVSAGSHVTFNLTLRPENQTENCPGRFSWRIVVTPTTTFDTKTKDNVAYADTNVTCPGSSSASDSSSRHSCSAGQSPDAGAIGTSSSSQNSSSVAQGNSESLPQSGGFLLSAADRKSIVMRDVRVVDWFAPFVLRLMQYEVVSGYYSPDGIPLGLFGPGDNVTYAQIAKMAVKAKALSIEGQGQPKNRSAKGAWSAPYVALMEQKGISAFKDGTSDVNAPAPRGAVLQMLYEIYGVQPPAAKGGYYRDVGMDMPFARYIEAATDARIVSGDAGTGIFRPVSPINRAEAAKIMLNFMERIQ